MTRIRQQPELIRLIRANPWLNSFPLPLNFGVLAAWRSFHSAQPNATKYNLTQRFVPPANFAQNKPNASGNFCLGNGLNGYARRARTELTIVRRKPVSRAIESAAAMSDNPMFSHKTLSPAVDNPNKTRQKAGMPRGFGVGQTSRFALQSAGPPVGVSVVQKAVPAPACT
jgi:hypothetical protein